MSTTDVDLSNLARVRRCEALRRLARLFVERAEALNYKGKKRDDAALDFFCGAAAIVEESDPALYAHIGQVAVMLISVRGYVAVKDLTTYGA